MRQISLLILAVGFVFPGLISGDTLKVTMGPKQPKILSVEECKKIAERNYNSVMKLLKNDTLGEYKLLSGAKITDWQVYLGADNLPYVVEFLFKKDGLGVWNSTVLMRDEGIVIEIRDLDPTILKRHPDAQCRLHISYLPRWIDTLRSRGYEVDSTTPYRAYYFDFIWPKYFVVYELEKDGKKEEVVIGLAGAGSGIFPSKDVELPSWVKTLEDMKRYEQAKQETLRRHLEQGDQGRRDDFGGEGGKDSYEYRIFVPGVPAYSQSWLGKKCAAVSCTDIMMYWDHTKEGWLDNSDEYTYVEDFSKAKGWNADGSAPLGAIAPGIVEVAWKHGDEFDTYEQGVKETTFDSEEWRRFRAAPAAELGEQRPMALVDLSYEGEKGHAYCCVGYWEYEEAGKIVHMFGVHDGRDEEPIRRKWIFVNYRNKEEVKPWTFISTHPVSRYPTVVYTDPPKGAEGVDIDYQVKITFSKKMNTESVESGITINPDYDREYQWSEDQRVVTIIIKNPEKDLEFLTEYQITIAGSVEDITGKTLDGNKNGKPEGSPEDDYIFTFTTREPKYV